MKPLHVACAIALGLTLVASTPLALAEPAQTNATYAVATNAHPVANAIPGYYRNTACAQRVMADWTRLTALSDTIKACNTAGEQRAVADPPPHTALPDPPKAGNTAGAQRAMADWTRLTARPDTTAAGNTVGK